MDLKSGTLLVPPAVKNSSCSHPRYTSHNFLHYVGIAETIEAVLILILTLGVIGANALVIFVINNRRYSPYIHQQPRYLLTSLALNDLTIGLLITPFGLLPALFHCWPYGEIFCQIQALLRGALSQQSAVILVCMAIDRYMCALHPRRYYQHSSKKGCVAILSLTWIISLTIFGFLVLPKGYYFNNTGLMACEPFYSKPSYRILATCAFYFPTTMVLMYCYGSSFHMSRFRLNDPTMPLTAAAHHPAYQHHPLHHYHHYQHTHPHIHHYHHRGSGGSSSAGGGGMGGGGGPGGANTPSTMLPNTPVMNLSMAMSMGLGINTPANTITKKIVPIQEKNSSGSTSRSMATISLGFIVMVTPWTIQEIVTACTGSKLPPFLDFLVTWTALSNSFWNPFMYWLLNADFRRLSKQLLALRCNGHEDTPEHKSPCCHINSDFEITTLPMPPEPPTSRPPQNNGNNGSGGGGGGGTNTTASGLVGAGSVGGSVLGICARARSNSLNRSTSFHIRDGGGGGGGVSNGHHTHHQHGYNTSTVRPDIEGLSEKYWGEILERTVSSNSLHAAMQKSFIPTSTHQQHYGQQQLQHHHGHHQHATGVNNPIMMMTTSFSKQSDLNLHIREHDDNLVDSANTMSTTSDLNKFSTSEPKLCEHEYQQQQQQQHHQQQQQQHQHHLQHHQHHHDIHCAKTKANTEANKSLGTGAGGGVVGGGGGGGGSCSTTNPSTLASCGSVPDI